jgi:hypothetical protein
MVEFASAVMKSIGICELSWDHKILSSGEQRDTAICAAIVRSDLFQLFWSESSRKSKEVEREWKFALSLGRAGFVRPVYWVDPLPRPPKNLKSLFFARLPYNGDTIQNGVRPFVNIERIQYMQRNYTVTTSGQGNVVNVAEFMSGIATTITQNLSQGYVPKETKALLTTLAEQLTEVAPKVSPSVAEQLGSDAKTLSEEVKGSRRVPWLKLALEGLTSTATAIGEVGKPILDVTSELMKLLVPQSPG